MRTNSYVIKLLGLYETSTGFLENENPVIFRIINEVNGAVTCYGVRAVYVGCHDRPVGERRVNVIVINDSVVIAVDDEICAINISDICGNAQI